MLLLFLSDTDDLAKCYVSLECYFCAKTYKYCCSTMSWRLFLWGCKEYSQHLWRLSLATSLVLIDQEKRKWGRYFPTRIMYQTSKCGEYELQRVKCFISEYDKTHEIEKAKAKLRKFSPSFSAGSLSWSLKLLHSLPFCWHPLKTKYFASFLRQDCHWLSTQCTQ